MALAAKWRPPPPLYFSPLLSFLSARQREEGEKATCNHDQCLVPRLPRHQVNKWYLLVSDRCGVGSLVHWADTVPAALLLLLCPSFLSFSLQKPLSYTHHSVPNVAGEWRGKRVREEASKAGGFAAAAATAAVRYSRCCYYVCDSSVKQQQLTNAVCSLCHAVGIGMTLFKGSPG